MRHFFIPFIIASICFYGCKNTEKHQHDHSTTEAHALHEHEHESHAHDSHAEEAHDHDAHNHDAHGHEEATVHPAATAHSDEIIFTKAQAAKTDFEVKEIQPGTFQHIIKTSGQILSAPGDESVIVATNNGVISYADNKLAAGQAVKQNQALFYIASKHLGEGDYYARTEANYKQAKAAYDRAETLIKDRIISEKDFETARLNYQNAKIAFEAIAGKSSDQGVGITSPLNGFIKNINVKDGEYVTTGQAIATVSQNKKLILQADVSEKYYPYLNSINNANFKTPYDDRVYTLQELSGKLLSIGKSARENSFFVPVTFELDNRGEIIPGSFVEIYLLSYPMENVMSIPVSALTQEMGYFYVYRQLDEEGYQKQEIKIGANNGKEVQVLSGLKPGDRIVTRGAYQVKMASATTAIPGHSHEH